MALKLDIGSGDHKNEGFTTVDKFDEAADVRADACDLPFPDGSVEEITCYQVIEHIPYKDEQKLFTELHRVLKVGGKLITECPDLEYIAQEIAMSGDIAEHWIWNIYGQVYRPWDKGRYEDWEDNANSRHQNGFTFKKLQFIADKLGFDIRKRSEDEKYSRYPENLSVEWIKR